MRKMTTALLLGAAALGFAMPAAAQENEGAERGQGGWRAEQIDRGDQAAPTGERARGWARPAPAAQEVRPAAVPPSDMPRREWRGGGEARSAERPSPGNGWQTRNQAEVERQGWRGRWENGAPQSGGTATPPVTATPAPPARDGRWGSSEGGTRPDWRRNDQGRPDWRRDDGARDQAWRDRRNEEWRRNQDAQRDDRWQRDRQWRDQQWRDQQWRDRQDGSRWGRDDRRYQYDRRLTDRYRWQDQRRWNDGWRNDRRYDWRDYRRSYASVYRLPPYRAPYGWSYGYRRFSIGIFLSNFLFDRTYWIGDPFSYRLPPAYGSLRWVRYYDDALLVDVRDGYVVDVVHDVFW